MNFQIIKETVIGWLPSLTGAFAIIVASSKIINFFAGSTKKLKDEVCAIVKNQAKDTEQVAKTNLQLIKENNDLREQNNMVLKLLQSTEKLLNELSTIQTLPEDIKRTIDQAVYTHFEKEIMRIAAIEDALKKAGIAYDEIEKNNSTN